jgi:hypothetical protein
VRRPRPPIRHQQAVAAVGADGVAAVFVFVVGCDAADSRVQAHAVVLDADAFKFGAGERDTSIFNGVDGQAPNDDWKRILGPKRVPRSISPPNVEVCPHAGTVPPVADPLHIQSHCREEEPQAGGGETPVSPGLVVDADQETAC